MATQKCTQCRIERQAEDFVGKNGKTTKTCKGCRERGMRSKAKNKEATAERTKKWKEENRERIKEYNKSYRTGTEWTDVKTQKGIQDKKPSTRRKEHVFIDGVEYKSCSKCNENRELKEYTYYASSWDGLRPTCNVCLHEYRMGRKEQMTEYNKKYWVETKEEQSAKHKEWKAANRDHVNEYHREYVRKWGKHQRDTNPQHKMTKNLRTRLWYALKAQGVEKQFKTFDLIGCSPDFLKGYLEAKFEEGMSWDNYGPDGWHIDHMIPCVSFDLTDPEQQKACFHYTNLQPLWASDNISKGGKVEIEYTYELNFIQRFF